MAYFADIERHDITIGNTIDIFAVLATMFGVATSLGLGVTQVNAGLNYLFDIPVSAGVQIALIAGITGMATESVVAGLNNGIRRISELNMILALILIKPHPCSPVSSETWATMSVILFS